jgi:endoglucanase
LLFVFIRLYLCLFVAKNTYQKKENPMELLKELCLASGVSGREDRLRKIVRRELEPIADEIKTDALGNVICIKKNSGAKKLMLAAHMDEIGFIVSHIDEKKGFLRLVGLGGHDPRNMVAQHVTVCGEKGDLTGLLYPGIKPVHLQGPGDKDSSPGVSDFIVDLGMPAEEVKENVVIGTPVTLQQNFIELGNCVSCKSLDNRLSLYVMIRAMQAVTSFGFEVYAVATVQEEIGLRGATTSAFGLEPDLGMALDITIAADIPGVPEHLQVTAINEGTAIKIQDGSAISHPAIVKKLKELANTEDIKYQMEILPRGGTDAGGIQKMGSGVPVGTISTPTRYVHSSIEMAGKADIQGSVDLMKAFIEKGNKGLELSY